MPLARTLANVEHEIQNGRLWRAKEILMSSLQNYGYDKELFEKIGDVLVMMGDQPGAGKFYFLSVEDEPEEHQLESIEVFLHRATPQGWRQLYRQFPKCARLLRPAEYSTYIDNTLLALDAPETLKFVDKDLEETGTDYWFGFCCMLILIFFVICFIAGFLSISTLVFQAIYNTLYVP